MSWGSLHQAIFEPVKDDDFQALDLTGLLNYVEKNYE